MTIAPDGSGAFAGPTMEVCLRPALASREGENKAGLVSVHTGPVFFRLILCGAALTKPERGSRIYLRRF